MILRIRPGILGILAILASLAPAALGAQSSPRLDLGGQLTANGEAERYLRVLQLVGQVPMYPVGSRPWNRQEARANRPAGEHPWRARFDTGAGSRVKLLRPVVTATYNSGLPQGEGEGAVWLGKGLTVEASYGARVQWRMLDIQVAPVVFWAQNAAFALTPNGNTGDSAYWNAHFPRVIDLPQRYGDRPLARIDPGYSRISVDTRAVSAGFATQPLAWGPARNEPLVIGPLAGGFPHGFVGSGQPLPVWIGTVHLKYAVGRLEQSALSPVDTAPASRMLTAITALFQPRGVPGLEVGGIRIEHRGWRAGVLSLENIARPFSAIFNDNVVGINSEAENGYASVFFRWATTHGLEVYGEYGREDYTWSPRTLLLKPDDLGNLLLGFQYAMRRAPERMDVVRAEVINAETSSNEVGQRGRLLIPPYTHGGLRQGHTLRGQVLGSPTAFGGAGWSLALDQYRPSGRTTWTAERRLVRDWIRGRPLTEGGPEVQLTARVDQLRTGIRESGDLVIGAGITHVLNHQNVRGADRTLLQLRVGWRGF